MDIVVNQLKQKPHNIPQYEGGDQVPVDDVSKTPYAPTPTSRIKDAFYCHGFIEAVQFIQSKVRL